MGRYLLSVLFVLVCGLMLLPLSMGACGGSSGAKSCETDTDCSDDQYCGSDDICHARVYPDGGDDGSSDGDDDGSGGDTTGDGGSDGANGDEPICDELNITATEVPPNMLLVVDKSGSMEDSISSSDIRTKMTVLKQAVDTLLSDGQGSIRFGWMSYPDCTGSCSYGYCNDGQVSVDVGDSSVTAIQFKVAALTSAGGTPTGGSLEEADSYFQGLNDTAHRHFVVLITDGMPTCPNGDGRDTPQADADLALAAVNTLKGHGVDTFIIGLGEGINNSNPQLLNDMAEAGGWARSGATKYYQANSLDQLQMVLDEIGGMVIGCNLSLDEVPEFPSFLWVYFDGQAVPRDGTHQNGWDYDASRNAIDFFGAYCDMLRNGDVTSVDIEMGCAPPD